MCPRCDREECAKNHVEGMTVNITWQDLKAYAQAWNPRECKRQEYVPTLAAHCDGEPIDWRARALKAEAELNKLKSNS